MAPLPNSKSPSSFSKFWVIRRCDSLKSPAIFSAWEDCSFYVDADENDGDVTYRSFDELCDAVLYAFPSVDQSNSNSNSNSNTDPSTRKKDATVPVYSKPSPTTSTRINTSLDSSQTESSKIVDATRPVGTNRNDVFCGRGGFVNHNPGNKYFRRIVSRYKKEYTEAGRDIKHDIAEKIVNEIRKLDPPGRFLQRNQAGDWLDIGDARAIGKTKQALREFDAPIRDEGDVSDGDGEAIAMTTPDAGEAKAYVQGQGQSPSEGSPSFQGDQNDMKRPLGQLTNCIMSPRKKIRPPEETSYGLRHCVPLTGPTPPFFQGKPGINVTLPEFHSLANFRNIAAGLCRMCGLARPKKGTPGAGEAVIPTQNKGVCTVCDVKVWVVHEINLQIKWCKGCKNFRSWAAFGEKGHTTKCMPCRDYQAKRYQRKKYKGLATA
jgi:hypothetical protein